MDNKMLSNWYYVVYFRAVRKNYILPGSWIQNIENHAEKFLNYGMNTTQSFLCFYTSNPQAFEENKCPKSDWPVNFSLKNRDSLQSDGCFIGKLLKCSANYNDALAYMNGRRCVEPAIYNEDRLNETPIPVIPIHAEQKNPLLEMNRSLNELELDSNKTVDNIEKDVDEATDGAIGGTLAARVAGTIDFTVDDISIIVNVNGDKSETKSGPFESDGVCNDSISHIANQLHELKAIIVDGDLTFFVSSEGFAKPLQTIGNFCVKQENDVISGDLPYYNKKSGRVYKIGECFRLIPSMIVSKFIDWNTPPRNVELELDKRFVSALFLVLLPIEEVAAGMFPKDVNDFVYELLKVRCHGDEQRLISFEKYKVETGQQAKEKNLEKDLKKRHIQSRSNHLDLILFNGQYSIP